MPRDPVAPMTAGMLNSLAWALAFMASAWSIVSCVQGIRSWVPFLDGKARDERLARSAALYLRASFATIAVLIVVWSVGASIYGVER